MPCIRETSKTKDDDKWMSGNITDKSKQRKEGSINNSRVDSRKKLENFKRAISNGKEYCL